MVLVTQMTFYAANYNNDNFDEATHHFIGARAGDDELFAGGGMTALWWFR